MKIIETLYKYEIQFVIETRNVNVDQQKISGFKTLPVNALAAASTASPCGAASMNV